MQTEVHLWQQQKVIIQANGDIKFVWGANAEMALGAYAATQSIKSFRY